MVITMMNKSKRKIMKKKKIEAIIIEIMDIIDVMKKNNMMQLDMKQATEAKETAIEKRHNYDEEEDQ